MQHSITESLNQTVEGIELRVTIKAPAALDRAWIVQAFQDIFAQVAQKAKANPNQTSLLDPKAGKRDGKSAAAGSAAS